MRRKEEIADKQRPRLMFGVTTVSKGTQNHSYLGYNIFVGVVVNYSLTEETSESQLFSRKHCRNATSTQEDVMPAPFVLIFRHGISASGLCCLAPLQYRADAEFWYPLPDDSES